MTANGRYNSGNGNVLRTLEAGYWRLRGKQVRADNVLSGARGTFVDRWRQGQVNKGEQLRAYAPSGVSGPIATGASTSDAEGQPPTKAKARLSIPFYGVEPQVFRNQEVIFTCVVGDRHILQEPQPGSPYEHVLYVDRDLKLPGWGQRPVLFWDASPKLITLFHKFALASLVPDGTKMLWVDSRVVLTNEVAAEIFETLDSNDLCLFRHYERDCVYDETMQVLEAGRSTGAECEEYVRHLRDVSFPRHGGLYETGVMGFRVCPEVRALFRKVFGLCHRYVARDQLVLPLALAASPVRVSVYNSGVTHLRDSPGIIVKSWKDELGR
jgi:hypothetical protein